MGDRPRITRLLCDRRIRMQRIEVAAQPVDQRRFRTCPEIAGHIGSARRQRMWRRRLAWRAAEAAVATGECGVRYGCNWRPGVFVADLALRENQGSLARALVDDLDDLLLADDGALALQR